MQLRTNNSGYTIVEVMIFLAVSGIMFIIAAGFINGKQASAEFRQSTVSINTDIQKLATDVGNGYYPVQNDLSCILLGGDPVVKVIAGETQGTHEGCVYVGKLMLFTPGSSSYEVRTVVGRRIAAATGYAPASFDQANPKTSDLLVSTGQIQWGTTLKKMKNVSTGEDLRGIGFFTSFGKFEDASSGLLVSGGQSVLVVPIPSGVNNSNLSKFLHDNADAKTESNPHIEACFDSGNGRFAKMTFGSISGASQRLASKIQIVNGDCS